MGRERRLSEAPTRRECIRYGGAVAVGSLFVGCVGRGDNEPGAAVPNAPTAAQTDTKTESDTQATDATESYVASIEPVGEVSFEQSPETVVGGWGFVGDVLMALGHADRIAGMARPGFWYQGFYELLPNVSARNTTEIPATVSKSYRIKQELLYELDPDLLATDPNRFIGWYGVEPEAVSTFQAEVAPFFGNESRSKRPPEWASWPDDEAYDYYAIPEFVERYGQLFGEVERAEAMIDLYEATINDITSRLPPKSERPTVGLVNAFTNPESDGFFGVNKPNPALEETHERRQYGDLGVVDAFEGEYSDNGHYGLKTGFEGLLDADPDVLVFDEAVNALGGQNVYGNADAYEQTLTVLKTNEIGKQLTAVKNDRLYPGGTGSQGPIINLFQTEMLAKQLYPDEYGEWRGFDQIPPDERLFDRQRVADIINGDF